MDTRITTEFPIVAQVAEMAQANPFVAMVWGMVALTYLAQRVLG